MTEDLPADPGGPGRSDLVPLAADRLVHACDSASLGFVDTSELEPQDSPLGQGRVLAAIDFGVGIARSGYNLYVMGSAGVGRHHLLKHVLEARAASRPAPADWCHVADFARPDHPAALRLPAAHGAQLRDDMRQLVEDLLTALPAAFQSDEYRRRR